MAGITLADAEERLQEAQDALEAILERGQSYRIGEREYARADLRDVMALVDHWDTMVKRLDRGGIRSRLGTPV